ncbi:hypothetical protein J5Y03_19460 [Bacillus sp. RG28]|uniref:Uncharacterized protein n=1 Tax=Gottfriedia endophytica TaxID=2820819 RepID=A0A940SIH8_9BACI|nr:hypothetical protein [Gottfriedia endophytica]MBP0727322.1 hypothetical protein [Gottfriedia endophytica]
MDQERQNPETISQETIAQERISNEFLTLIGRLFTLGSAIFFIIGAIIGVITAINDINIAEETAAVLTTAATA